jgi:hypothetical protein
MASRIRPLALAGLAVLVVGSTIRADDRRFGFVEMTDTLPTGGFETEQWFTWMHQTREIPSFNQFNFKHEFEYGITDQLQLGVDLIEWHITTGAGDENDGPRYDETAAELKYRFTDPHNDPLGVAWKVELGGGDRHIGLESRFVLDKYIDKWLPAYNLVVEAEWGDRGFTGHDGSIEQTAGISYEFATGCFAGLEFQHVIEMPDWTANMKSSVYLGPNFSYHRGAYEKGNWAITVTPLIRLGGEDDTPALQLRLLFELDF